MNWAIIIPLANVNFGTPVESFIVMQIIHVQIQELYCLPFLLHELRHSLSLITRLWYLPYFPSLIILSDFCVRVCMSIVSYNYVQCTITDYFYSYIGWIVCLCISVSFWGKVESIMNLKDLWIENRPMLYWGRTEFLWKLTSNISELKTSFKMLVWIRHCLAATQIFVMFIYCSRKLMCWYRYSKYPNT